MRILNKANLPATWGRKKGIEGSFATRNENLLTLRVPGNYESHLFTYRKKCGLCTFAFRWKSLLYWHGITLFCIRWNRVEMCTNILTSYSLVSRSVFTFFSNKFLYLFPLKKLNSQHFISHVNWKYFLKYWKKQIFLLYVYIFISKYIYFV